MASANFNLLPTSSLPKWWEVWIRVPVFLNLKSLRRSFIIEVPLSFDRFFFLYFLRNSCPALCGVNMQAPLLVITKKQICRLPYHHIAHAFQST